MDTRNGTMTAVEPRGHKAARPMKVVKADDGCTWLCDADVDEAGNLEEQGCWRCADVAFTRSD